MARAEVNWRADYDRARERSLNALEEIRPGDRVFVSSGCAEPGILVEQLVDRARRGTLPSCELYMMFGGSSGRLQDAASAAHSVITITATPSSDGRYFPWTIHQTARLLQTDQLAFDVACLHTSPPDDDGRASLGVSVDFGLDAFRQARVVVAQVNDRMPRTAGENLVDVRRFDGVIETSTPLLERASDAGTDASRGVAANVVGLIPDGATVEFGVGRVMTDILRSLHDHNDLGLHTGLFIDEMVDLIDLGVVTDARKRSMTGISVANQARGTQRTYEFLDRNPRVHMMPARFTHDAAVLAELPDFYAVNSALEVDLMGRVNSERRGGRRVSSTGGLGDFVRAAAGRVDGHSIIALNASSRQGGSRIVPRLADPAAVTITPDLADVVVTEFGVAHLRGLMPADRVTAMIDIADPAHRVALRDAAAGADV